MGNFYWSHQERRWIPRRGIWNRLRNKYHRAPCCSTCGGTGTDVTSPETNGLCWDCRATGHAHELSWWNR